MSSIVLGLGFSLVAGVNYEEAPINYRSTAPSNAVSKLQQAIDDGAVQLQFEGDQGYLRALLEKLDVPISSQVMPFGKLSRQNPKISPHTPRAIYFNDDIHVGYVRDGLIEIAVTDPALGMVFYTLEQSPVDKPQFRNDSISCLTCHGTAKTKNVPGLHVRSVIPDIHGEPVLAAGSFRTDHSSPIEKRWGGWYVSGRHGNTSHLGNLTLPDQKKPKTIVNSKGLNVSSLDPFFDTGKYLSPHSDIAALMVLEHQADGINSITTANFETRLALYRFEQQVAVDGADRVTLQKELDARIAKAGESLVKYFLFCGEAEIPEAIESVSGFAAEFSNRGPADKAGRSLRTLQLHGRLFKYPCSYLIYSDAFHALPPPMKSWVLRRLREILTSDVVPTGYEHLNTVDRRAMVDILSDTMPGF
ncbi:MAG: hypothetical protein U0892_19120 [Pirellulales bacterium]